MKMTRGIRNNNPGNLELNPANKWDGMRRIQNDGRFVQFIAMPYGLRALLKTLMTYHKKGVNTIEKIIRRWAPEHENPTGNYGRYVAAQVGVDPDVVLDPDGDELVRVAKAIVRFENGADVADHYISEDDWSTAVDLLVDDAALGRAGK